MILQDASYVDEILADAVLNGKVREVLHCEKGDRYSEVFKRADESLYEVKNSGKCGFAMR